MPLDLKNIDETKNHFLEEIKQNELSKRLKKVCKILNYTGHLLILSSIITGCVSFFCFASLVNIPAAFASSAAGIKICAITALIKKCKSTIKKDIEIT